MRSIRIPHPSHALVVAYLALFLALGGTSYAAVSITGKDVKNSSLTGKDIRNSSLTSNDVRNGSLLKSDFKSGQLPAGAKGAPGATGLQGTAGPAGPTVGAGSGTSTPPASPDGLMTSFATTLSTPSAGAVFAIAQLNLGMSCPPGGTFNCSFVAGLYVDGVGVPGSTFGATVTLGATTVYPLDLFGVLKNVPAGSHTVTVGWKAQSPNPATHQSESGWRSSAIFLGG
jgi:hypothetical protein